LHRYPFCIQNIAKEEEAETKQKNATVVEWMRMAEWGVPKHSILLSSIFLQFDRYTSSFLKYMTFGAS